MRISIILLFVLYFQYNFSQNIKVNYKVVTERIVLEDSLNQTKNQSRLNYLKKKKYAQNLKFELIATQNNSYFSGIKIMESELDLTKLRFAKTISRYNSKYYVDLENKVSYQSRKFLGKNVLTKKHYKNINWKLINEKKKIGNYICFKAISQYEVVNRVGTFIKKVEAWYSPELNYSFGPKSYFGLPGLILELTDNDITFVAEKINLNYIFEDTKILIKPNYKIYTEKDINIMIKKHSESFGIKR